MVSSGVFYNISLLKPLFCHLCKISSFCSFLQFSYFSSVRGIKIKVQNFITIAHSLLYSLQFLSFKHTVSHLSIFKYLYFFLQYSCFSSINIKFKNVIQIASTVFYFLNFPLKKPQFFQLWQFLNFCIFRNFLKFSYPT